MFNIFKLFWVTLRSNLSTFFPMFMLIFFLSLYYIAFNLPRSNNLNIFNSNVSQPASSSISSSSSSSENEYSRVEESSVFSLVTNFEKINPNFDIENGNYNLYTLSNYHVSNFCSDFKITKCSRRIVIVTLENLDQVYEKLHDSDSFALLKNEDLDFRLKIVNIGNQNVFDKSFDLTSYPLKISNSLILDKTESQKIENSKWKQDNEIKLGHTGSFLAGRGVILHTNLLHNGDYRKMIAPMLPLFKNFDIMSATQETSLKGDGVYCFDCLSFVGSEKVMDQMVVPLGIDIVTMAANHILDGGVDDLTNTFRLYKEKGIPIVGASDVNNDLAIKPVLVEKNGIKIAYLAINDTPGRSEWADENSPGAASASDWDIVNGVTVKYEPNLERIKKMVQSAKDLQPDLIILLPHWGAVEYQNIPTKYVQNLAHLFLDEGVDIIIGDHPHWVQEMEWYKRKSPSYSGMTISPIFYSVGNFVFDQMWSIETRQGMTVELNFYNKRLLNIDLHPHQLYLYDRGTVEPLDKLSNEYRQTLERVFSVSDL